EDLAVLAAQGRGPDGPLDLEELGVKRSLAAADLLGYRDAERQGDGSGTALRPGDHATRHAELDRHRIAVLMAFARRLGDRAEEADVIRLRLVTVFVEAHGLGSGPNDDRRTVAILGEIGGGIVRLVLGR